MKSFFIVLSTYLALAAAPASEDLVLWITLDKEVQAEGLIVRLGDVARISGLDKRLVRRAERIEVGRFEAGREQLVLKRASLSRLLAAQGIQGPGVVFRGATEITIKPKAVKISGQRLERIVRRHLKNRLGPSVSNEQIRPATAFRSVSIPKGRYRFDLAVEDDPKNPHLAGRVNLVIRVDVDGRPARRIPAPMMIDRKITALVAKRRIGRGRPLAASDLELAKISVAGTGNGYFTAQELVIGQVAKASILRGQPVRAHMLRTPPVIRKNDMVTAQIKVGGLTAKTLCRALSDASVGETIELVNVESKKRVMGRVIDSRTVDASPQK